MKLRNIVLIAILGTAGYFLVKKDIPPPRPIVRIDPGKIRNRHEVIRSYERAIVDLEKLTYRSTASVKISSATNYTSYKTTTQSIGVNNAANAHREQIEEYRRRIAVMKAEIGE